MRLNSARSIKLAEAVYRKYGSWDAALANSDYHNGKFVLREPMDPIALEPREKSAKKGD